MGRSREEENEKEEGGREGEKNGEEKENNVEEGRKEGEG